MPNTKDLYEAVYDYTSTDMKKLIFSALTLAISQATVVFAGPEPPSKEVVAPPPPPPLSYFRPNEFDIGAFATYVTGTNGGGSVTRQSVINDGTTFTLSSSGSPYGWGGGMDFTYWTPWRYAGVRFQGAGVELSTQTLTVTSSNGERFRSGSGSAAAGVINGDILLRLPLDDFWPAVHLAPYVFGGGGGVFTGAGGQTINTPFPEVNNRFNNASENVSNNRGMGHLGGGAEYRFTPHIGIFGEAGYNWVAGGNHERNSGVKDFVQVNFGLRYAF